MDIRWGIDLGGTKIEGIVFREADGFVLARLRLPTESWNGYDHILNQISKLITELQNTSRTKSDIIGMCTPGTLDPILGVMKNSNTTCLNGRNLPADLQQLTGIEFRTSNDANCFAIAEANMGVVPRLMPEARVVFGAIMGTGCGGGLVVDGKIIGGRQGIGGEWGHNFLHESGGPCYCGKTGCVEMVISGPALEKYYAQQSGNHFDMAEITRRYREGSDEVAIQTMERLFHFFGQAISVVINIADPDAIVIGGGLGNIDELYTLGVAQIQQHIFNHRLDTKFFKPMLGDSAGVYGAAFLY
jgi:fructokinase